MPNPRRHPFTNEDQRLLAKFLARYPENDRTKPSTFKAFIDAVSSSLAAVFPQGLMADLLSRVRALAPATFPTAQHPNTNHTLQSWQDHYKKAGRDNVNAFIKQEIKKRQADRTAKKKAQSAEREPEAGPSHATPTVARASVAAPPSTTKPSRHSIAKPPPRPSSNNKKNTPQPDPEPEPESEPEPEPEPEQPSSPEPEPVAPVAVAGPSPASRRASTRRASARPPSSPPAPVVPADDGEDDDRSMLDSDVDELASSPKRRRSVSSAPRSRSRNPFTADDFDYFVKRLAKFNAQRLQLGELYRTLANEVSRLEWARVGFCR